MIEKGVRIISLEASEIYKHIMLNGQAVGYVLPTFEDEFNYDRIFKNKLDYSLDMIELEKACEQILCEPLTQTLHGSECTFAIVNLKFTRNYKVNEDGKNVEVKLLKLREYFYENGFNIGGVHYVRYKRSSGSSRQGKCLFINEKLLSHMEQWGECGLDCGGELASWESYKALSLSSIKETIDIPLEGILFIPDYKSVFLSDAVSVKIKDGELVAIGEETEIKNDIWDGESLLDESLFNNERDKGHHMLLLRNKFFKSCGFRTKLQKWFKDKNITLEDLRARGFITLADDISQIVMVTTPSSMKFLKFMGDELNEDNVRRWIEKVDSTFGVVKYDKRTKFFDGKMVQTSYQFLNTLALTKEQVESVLRVSEDYMHLIWNDYDFLRYHFTDAYNGEKEYDDTLDDENELIVDGLASRSDVIFALMDINYDFCKTKLFKNFRQKVKNDLKERLTKGHILLSGTNATLFGNGPEMLYALSGEFDLNNADNEPMVLEKKEIYCKRFDHKKKLVCARSPHVTMGNLYCVENNCGSDIWEQYFDLGDNIVCVNAIKENIQQRLNGCDYDSDAMLITDDELIVDVAFTQGDYFPVPVCKIDNSEKEQTLTMLDYETSENKIGEIVNLSQILNSVLWEKVSSETASGNEIENIYHDICILAVLSGIEIDKAKRTYANVNVQKTLKDLEDKYESYGRPHFFVINDEKRIDRDVRKVRDKDPVVQKEKRDQKRKELREEKEKKYRSFATAMEYVYQLAKEIDFRKGKRKNVETIKIIDMIKKPAIDTSTDYKKRDKIIEICEEYCKKINGRKEARESAPSDEKEVIYEQILRLEKLRDEEVEQLVTNERVLYLVLKKYDYDQKKGSENWHLYAPLLKNKIFKGMLNASREKMNEVYANTSGEFTAYGLRFSKYYPKS